MEKPCLLTLVDDTEHEEVEELRLVLGTARSDSPYGAAIGAQNETLVRIQDHADSKTQHDTLTSRRTDRQTDRQADKQTDRQTDRQMGG